MAMPCKLPISSGLRRLILCGLTASEIAIDRPQLRSIRTCAAIVTGGYLPEGADAVIMVEHTKPFGAGVIEMRRSVAPGEYVIKGDDAQEGAPSLSGNKLRAQKSGS
ncbi:MAG: hypothetical protein ACLRWP_08055 [Bilophila wadsworthia]